MHGEGNTEVAMTFPSEREILFKRHFQRTHQLLFEAWTKPEHVRQWWGCDGSTLTICEIDLRVGGSWRFVMRMANGSDHPFRGIYREIVPNARLIYSECYELSSIGNLEWLTTVTFEAAEGGTLLTHRILHPSRQARDMHLRASMQEGAVQSMRRLNDHVAAMPGTNVHDEQETLDG